MGQNGQQSSTLIDEISKDGVIPKNRTFCGINLRFPVPIFIGIILIIVIMFGSFIFIKFYSTDTEDKVDEMPKINSHFENDEQNTLTDLIETSTNNIPIEEYPGFLNFPSKCGPLSSKPKIGNGDKADLSEFPWHVVMRRPVMMEETIEFPFCGGSLLTQNLILSAAHCIKDLEHPQSYIILGEHDLFEDPDCDDIKCADPVQRFHSSELVTIIHPDYNNETKVNDLALIKLKRPAKFSKSVAPICLPFHEKNLPEKIIVAGYGATEKDFFPEVLMKMTVPIIDIEKCREKYADKSITKNHFCAIEHKISNLSGKSFNVSTDSCRGDSGSPAFFPSSLRFVQYGIVSWGAAGGCGANFKSPGVYVLVYPYIEWILRNSFV